MDIHRPLFCINFNFSWFSKKLRPFMTFDGIKNLFRLWKVRGKIKFATWKKHEYYNFDCSFLRYIKKDHYPCLKTNLATFIWFLEKWHYLKVMGVIQSNFWGASYGAYYIFTQNYVEAKLLEPLLWNFAWVNGRSCAFRQNQSGYPNVNTLGTT